MAHGAWRMAHGARHRDPLYRASEVPRATAGQTSNADGADSRISSNVLAAVLRCAMGSRSDAAVSEGVATRGKPTMTRPRAGGRV